MKKELQGLVEKLEAAPTLPSGSDERFNGYAGMGVPFRSGHILAMRHFAYTSINGVRLGLASQSCWRMVFLYHCTSPPVMPALLWRYGIGLCANRYANSMEGR